jgi:hypothetical protein
MLAGFEQAFGTVEWPFIGQACVKWIKYIYTDIPSAVINKQCQKPVQNQLTLMKTLISTSSYLSIKCG